MITNPFSSGQTTSGHDLYFELRTKAPGDQKGLFAKKPFRGGDMILTFYPEGIYGKPRPETLQVGFLHHISMQPQFLRFANHSCDPNIFIDTTQMRVRALRDIAEGEELCFFYPATEWIMEAPFQCSCGAANCLGRIRGAAFLLPSIARKYQLNHFISERIT
jgi:hypothetical protein